CNDFLVLGPNALEVLIAGKTGDEILAHVFAKGNRLSLYRLSSLLDGLLETELFKNLCGSSTSVLLTRRNSVLESNLVLAVRLCTLLDSLRVLSDRIHR